jgi:hypothetical protein
VRAEAARWLEMGKSEYGPHNAMMLCRPGFEDPKMEPLGSITLIIGKVPGGGDMVPWKVAGR